MRVWIIPCSHNLFLHFLSLEWFFITFCPVFAIKCLPFVSFQKGFSSINDVYTF